MDDDSYDDRRTILSLKAYESDSAYRGLIAPSNVMLHYTINLEETFVKHFRNLQKATSVGHGLLQLLDSISLVILLTKISSNAIYQTTDILLSEVCKQRAEVTRKEE